MVLTFELVLVPQLLWVLTCTPNEYCSEQAVYIHNECCASRQPGCAVLNAYTTGKRADDMADQAVMVALTRRYAFKL
jgi:hypothetical protein